MNKFYRLFALSLVLLLVLPLALSVGAQEMPGPGEGGAVIRGNTRGSANLGSLLRIRCSGVDCADVTALTLPTLVGLDAETNNYSPDTVGQLANGWTISEDGTTYTVTMRQDATWNDGTPITSLDVYFAWDLMQQGQAIGLSSSFAPSAQQLINAEIIDDYTIAFSLPKLLLDDELCGQALHLARPFDVVDDLPAGGLVAEQLAEGNLLTAAHTLAHYRRALYTPGPIWDRQGEDSWAKGGRTTLMQRAAAEVERRLASVQPVETDPAIQRELRRLLLAGVDLAEGALPAVSPPRAAAPARPRGHQRRRA